MIRVFDRLIHFDSRSREFNVGGLFHRDKKSVVRVSTLWSCPVFLNQGAEGACTGFAVATEAAADPVRVPNITEHVARALYARAKQLDEWPGEDYEGSSVLGAMKAAKELGWYTEYRWAFSEADLAQAVCTLGPAIIGINWYDGMQDTNRVGMVFPTGKRVGGHAICIIGYNAMRDAYILRNSWGIDWGRRGNCMIRAADMARLLKEDGEACIPVVRVEKPAMS